MVTRRQSTRRMITSCQDKQKSLINHTFVEILSFSKKTGEENLDNSTEFFKITERHLKESTSIPKVTGDSHLNNNTCIPKVTGESHFDDYELILRKTVARHLDDEEFSPR